MPQDAGKITAEIGLGHAASEFKNDCIVQDRLFESDFDWVLQLQERAGGDSGRLWR